jgi:hypothetical protein
MLDAPFCQGKYTLSGKLFRGEKGGFLGTLKVIEDLRP